MSKYQLFAAEGFASLIIEGLFKWADVEIELKVIPYDQDGFHDAELLKYNPLGQIPTLVTPTGQVLTESGAIGVYLSSVFTEANLAPAPHDEKYPLFLNWLFYLTGSIYPTFTYADYPQRITTNENVHDEIKDNLVKIRQQRWFHVEQFLKSKDEKYFLGNELGTLDIFTYVMVMWTPREQWFQTHCPHIYQIHKNVAEHPKLKPFWNDKSRYQT